MAWRISPPPLQLQKGWWRNRAHGQAMRGQLGALAQRPLVIVGMHRKQRGGLVGKEVERLVVGQGSQLGG